MPRRAWAMVGGLLAFLAVVLSIAGWAAWGDDAGSQRGLVIHSELADEVTVRLEDGQRARVGPERSEAAFVIKREQFPSTIRVLDADGATVLERRFEYAELAAADFRLSFDTNGFYRTTETRDTPAPTP